MHFPPLWLFLQLGYFIPIPGLYGLIYSREQDSQYTGRSRNLGCFGIFTLKDLWFSEQTISLDIISYLCVRFVYSLLKIAEDI